jgi:hypothetical protein
MSGPLLDTIVLGYMVAWPTALALLAVHFTGLLNRNSPYRELHAERPAASMSACRDAAERVQEAFG